jgi:hypothetical protein
MGQSISRDRFVSDLAGSDGALNINDLEPATAQALKDAGVKPGDLARIAGPDAQIATEAEYRKLFAALDRLDQDGSGSSFEVADDAGVATPAGEAYEQLKAEIARNRTEAHNRGIIHLGMRDASSSEVDALRRVTPDSAGGVLAIRAGASDDRVELDGKSYDLADAAGRAGYRDALINGSVGMPADKAKQLEALLAGATSRTRDELAQFGVALFQIGEGKLNANRLVLSGHGDGTRLVDDRGTRLRHDDLRSVAAAFPEGAGKIEHLAFSSCFSATNAADLRATRQAFPNLKDLWGYAGFSPSAEKGAPRDLQNWAGKTDGDDPSRMDPTGGNVATWNKADGDQNMVRLTTRDCEKAADTAQRIVDAYESGRRSRTGGAHDGELAAAYVRVAQAVNAEGIPAELRNRLNDLKATMYALRHPD